MKKNRVALMTKMKEESKCHQEAEKQCNRKIAQMLKVSCRQGNRIPCLEAHYHTKETALKRHHEEMATLWKHTSSAS
ncbi:hypothetical protein MRX96_035271 [Rhipicephalus microplus]